MAFNQMRLAWMKKSRLGMLGARYGCGLSTILLISAITLAKPQVAPVLAAERLHGDDTMVPVLAKGRTITGRVWTYVRDDRPFAGPGTPHQRCSATPVTAPANICSGTWPAMPGSCRPRPMPASSARNQRQSPSSTPKHPGACLIGPVPDANNIWNSRGTLKPGGAVDLCGAGPAATPPLGQAAPPPPWPGVSVPPPPSHQ
jgi:hypothetical protein